LLLPTILILFPFAVSDWKQFGEVVLADSHPEALEVVTLVFFILFFVILSLL
jgi:hypothetical protein